MEGIGEKYQFSPSVGPVTYVIILSTLPARFAGVIHGAILQMGTVRLSRELTQSYADRAEVQDFSFHPLAPRPLTQAPPPEPLRGVASAHRTSLITGRRWTRGG